MFKPLKPVDGQVEILELVLHNIAAIDAAIVVAEDKKDLRALMSLMDDLSEATNDYLNIYSLLANGQEEEVEEEEEEFDEDSAPRSKQPVGFLHEPKGNE